MKPVLPKPAPPAFLIEQDVPMPPPNQRRTPSAESAALLNMKTGESMYPLTTRQYQKLYAFAKNHGILICSKVDASGNLRVWHAGKREIQRVGGYDPEAKDPAAVSLGRKGGKQMSPRKPPR